MDTGQTKFCLLSKAFVLTATFLACANCAVAQNDCTTEITSGSSNLCKGNTKEMYREIISPQGNRVAGICCKPGSPEEIRQRRKAVGCRTTECLSSTSNNICSNLRPRYVNNVKQEYEEVFRESCTLGRTSGVVALCCQPNSTESLLLSTLGAEDDEFPHQAKLKLPGHCGGTVYNKRFIITASHCIVNRVTGKLNDASKMTVILGSNLANVDSQEYVYKVKRAIPHPEYGHLATSLERKERPLNARFINDIALLELERDIQFGDNVKALEIAPKGFDPFKWANNAVVVGWGTTDTLTLAEHLQKANFVLRGDQMCFRNGKRYASYGNKENQLLCVGGVLEGKWSPTAGGGDSGGPAICTSENGHPVLCGVTSFGGSDDHCKENDDEMSCPPSVYSEVAYFHDWIVKTAGQQDPKTFYKPYLYGKKVAKGEYENQVRITSETGKSCGGTLIQADVVVTAAQCIFSGNGTHRGLKVTSGINEVNEKGTVLGVKAAKHLLGFKRKGIPGRGSLVDVAKQGKQVVITDDFYQNDLAVVLLNGKVNIPSGKLAGLPKFGERFHQGLELAFPRDTKHGGILMSREYNLLDDTECQKRTDRMQMVKLNVKVDKNVICAVEKYSGGSQCDRELGGGLFCKSNGKDVLCGVQNFRLCMFSIPNGFVNVGLYEDWIGKTITELRR